MRRHWWRGLLLGVSMVLLLPALAYAQGEVLYGCTSEDPSMLYILDPTTGAATLVGSMGMEWCSALDVSPGGVLYAMGWYNYEGGRGPALYTVSIDSGAATLVGYWPSPEDEACGVSDISFRSDGTLFGHISCWEQDGGAQMQVDEVTPSQVTHMLGIVNTATAAVTVVGPTGVQGGGNSIAFSPGDVLFHSSADELYTLNQGTGSATWVAALEFPDVECPSEPRLNALDFSSGGTLFGSLNCGGEGSGPNYLVTVNTANAVVTDVGASVDGLDGIAFVPLEEEFVPPEEEFVPEPGTVLLLGSGLIGLSGYAGLRWRSRDK